MRNRLQEGRSAEPELKNYVLNSKLEEYSLKLDLIRDSLAQA
jgi:hypothetical protein